LAFDLKTLMAKQPGDQIRRVTLKIIIQRPLPSARFTTSVAAKHELKTGPVAPCFIV
jgi:hypothetical protein